MPMWEKRQRLVSLRARVLASEWPIYWSWWDLWRKREIAVFPDGIPTHRDLEPPGIRQLVPPAARARLASIAPWARLEIEFWINLLEAACQRSGTQSPARQAKEARQLARKIGSAIADLNWLGLHENAIIRFRDEMAHDLERRLSRLRPYMTAEPGGRREARKPLFRWILGAEDTPIDIRRETYVAFLTTVVEEIFGEEVTLAHGGKRPRGVSSSLWEWTHGLLVSLGYADAEASIDTIRMRRVHFLNPRNDDALRFRAAILLRYVNLDERERGTLARALVSRDITRHRERLVAIENTVPPYTRTIILEPHDGARTPAHQEPNERRRVLDGLAKARRLRRRGRGSDRS